MLISLVFTRAFLFSLTGPTMPTLSGTSRSELPSSGPTTLTPSEPSLSGPTMPTPSRRLLMVSSRSLISFDQPTSCALVLFLPMPFLLAFSHDCLLLTFFTFSTFTYMPFLTSFLPRSDVMLFSSVNPKSISASLKPRALEYIQLPVAGRWWIHRRYADLPSLPRL
jgi:hypothetical protein